MHLHAPLGGVLPHQLTRSVKELFASVGILGFAVAAATIFEPIYLYALGFSIPRILLYYIIIYGLYLFLIPLGAKFALRFGVSRSILVGSSMLVLYFLALFGMSSNPILFYVAAVLYALEKMFYWIGYHADFAQFSTDEEVGREIGGMSLVVSITAIFGPVAGGAVASLFGFPVLFVIVAALILLSNIPLFASPSVPARVGFSYIGAFRRLFQKRSLRRVVTSLGFGEDFFVLTLWPIFVYLIVKGAVAVGLLATFTALCTSAILLYVGRLSDTKNHASVLWAGISIKILAWISRLSVVTGGQVLLTDTLYRVGSGATEYPILTETYRTAKKEDVMQTVVLFEMGLILGKLLAMVVVAALLLWTSAPLWPTVFVTGALFSLFYGALTIGQKR